MPVAEHALKHPAGNPELNRLAAQILRWSFILCILVYLPMWGGAMGLLNIQYAGRMVEGAWTNRVLLGLRELLPLAVIALALLANPRFFRQKVDGPVTWCLAVLLAGTIVFICRHPELSLLKCGIILGRFSVFFVLPFAVRGILRQCSPRVARTTATTLVGVLLLNAAVCFAQTRIMPPYEGSTALGSRAIGMSNNPNTAGSMLALAPLLILVPAAGKRGQILVFCAVCFAATLTTGSRAAMGGMALLLAVAVAWVYPRARAPILIVGLLGVVSLGASLNRLSGRYEAIRGMPESPRLAIARTAFAQAALDEKLIGRGIGVGTNSFFTLFGVRHELSIITDSLMTSWFMQFGFLGLLVLYTGVYHLFREMGPAGIMFFLFFLLFSLTLNLVEVYPTSFFLMAIAGMYEPGAENRLMNEKTTSMTWIDLLSALWSRWPWLLAAALVGGAAGYGKYRWTPEVYQAHVWVVPVVSDSLTSTSPEDSDEEEPPPPQPLPRFNVNVLAAMAVSGDAVGALLDRVGLAEEYTADEFTAFLSAKVAAGSSEDGTDKHGPGALRLNARAGSVAEARTRANAWADVLRLQADKVAADTAEQVRRAGEQQLDRGSAELAALRQRMLEVQNESQLSTREQEGFLLRHQYGQHLAQLASFKLLIEVAEAYADTLASAPSEAEGRFITAQLAAQSEVLAALRGIVAAEQDRATGPAKELADGLLSKLSVEAEVVKEVQRRVSSALTDDTLSDEERVIQSLIARNLAETAARLGVVDADRSGAGRVYGRHPDALELRDWEWPQGGPVQQSDEAGARGESPRTSPVWLPPLLFPGDIVARSGSPQLLMTDIRSAKVAAERLEEELVTLRGRIAEHEAATADLNWKVDQARQHYADMRSAYELLALRIQERRIAALQTGSVLEVMSYADQTGRVVSLGAYVCVRTGAVLGLALAGIVILGRPAARSRTVA